MVARPARRHDGKSLPRIDGLSEVHSKLVLELHGGLRARRREISRGAARPDHGRGDVPEGMGLPPRQPQHRGPDRRGPRLGRPGDDRRHAQPAAGLPLPDRARAPARQAGLRRRPGRLVEPASLRRGRLPGDRRGRAHHGGLHRRLGARRAQGRVHRREVQDRRHAEPAAALRPVEARAVSLHRRAVLARLPVHLRVLRHHRAVRPRAAHQDQRPDPRRTAGALRPRLSRPCRFRRRQFHRQPQEPAHR